MAEQFEIVLVGDTASSASTLDGSDMIDFCPTQTASQAPSLRALDRSRPCPRPVVIAKIGVHAHI